MRGAKNDLVCLEIERIRAEWGKEGQNGGVSRLIERKKAVFGAGMLLFDGWARKDEGMRNEVRRRVRRDLDEDLRVFRGPRVRRSRWGWLRGVRQALGMRVGEVGQRLKVGKSEVYRLEMSEARETITLKRLRAAAEAIGCEVVYAVVPRRGTLEDLAAELEKERRKQKSERRKSLASSDPYGFLKTLDTVLALTQWHTGRSGRVK